MLDTAAGTGPQIALQRAKGRALVRVVRREGRTRLADLAQSGSAKVLLPLVAGDHPEVVFLNTSGGLTGGDLLDLNLVLDPGAEVTATTQTAERAYQSRHGAARVQVTASLGPGARLDWLPQETILFQDSHLDRSTQIDLRGDARVLLAESLILGRQAMGETLTRCQLTDRRMVRRDGVPVWAEGLLLTPESLSRGALLLGGARALGVIALVARGAEDAASLLQDPRVEGARVEVSGWDGRLVVRIAAQTGLSLRRQMAAIITKLSGRALPRVWASGGLS